MEKAMKHRLMAQALATVLLMVLGSFLYVGFLRENSRKQVFSILSELSFQNTLILRQEVDKGFDAVEDMARFLEGLSWEQPEDVIGLLRPFVEKKGFLRIGIADSGGQVETTDDKKFNISDREYFQSCMAGKRAVSNTMEDKVDGEPIIVFSAPVYQKGVPEYVLFATYRVEQYREAMSTPTFHGEGFSYVVDGSGKRLLDSDHPNSFGEFDNFFEELAKANRKNGDAAEKLRQGIASQESGFIIYTYHRDNYLYYEPAGVNDWYLLTVIPKDLVSRWGNSALYGSYLFIFLCIGLLCALLAYDLAVQVRGYREVTRIAYVDSLTGGATYGKFKLEADRLLRNYPGKEYAIISMDVDNFQVINEVFGYEVGDDTLRYIWRTCEGALGPEETAARVFDDHFVALVSYDRDPCELRDRFEQLVEAVRRYQPPGRKEDHNIAISVGVYLVTDRGMSVDAMLNRAKISQKEVKGTATSKYGVYQEEKMTKKLFNKHLEDRFEQALRDKEFQIYFQPKYDLEERGFFGAEALVRWREPDGTLLMPGAFIPAFEQNGDITRLDEYMLREVCARIEKWEEAGLHTGPISVNVSRLQLLKENFVENYMSIIHGFHIPVSSIQLEFTETMMVENEEILMEVASSLHSHGVLVQMDDFGSGYSSLSMLKNVPIDILKLDKGFVDDLGFDGKSRAIVTGSISLAHTLGISVTAEGVENSAQFEFLAGEGCDAIQGYYCAKPMDEAGYEEILREIAGRNQENSEIIKIEK